MRNNIEYHYSPRVSVYHADGKGRDSYIYSNNGGLNKHPVKFISQNNYAKFNATRYYSLK